MMVDRGKLSQVLAALIMGLGMDLYPQENPGLLFEKMPVVITVLKKKPLTTEAPTAITAVTPEDIDPIGRRAVFTMRLKF